MMAELKVKGIDYQVGKLNALQQFHLARRLGPLMATVGISLASLRDGAKMDLGDFLPMAGPLADVLSHMSDEDTNYIIFCALSVVKRKQGDKWASVLASSSQLMFDDIDMPIMIRLVIEVLKVNLGNFLTGLVGENG